MIESPGPPVEKSSETHEPVGHPLALESGTPAAPASPGPVATSGHPVRRGWRWAVILLLLAVIAYFVGSRIAGGKTSAPETAKGKGKGEAGATSPVVTATARRGDIGVYFTGLGAVTPLATVTIKSRVDGQLTSVRYREGDVVHKGDLLVEIDDGPYRAALTQAEGQLMKDQAALENAKIDLVRYQQLVPQKAIPEQQLATQQATVHQDEGAVKLDQGQIDSAKVNLAYTKITAPVDGRIGLRLVDQGNIVNASDTNGLLVITQMDPISVIFTLAEDQLPQVIQKTGAGQKLEVDAYDRAQNTKLAQGSLTTLDNQIDPTTGTLKLRATFDNAKGALYPNQFVNVKLLVQEKHAVTLVPTAAVQRNSQAIYVYVVKQDSTVTVRMITLGTTEGDDSEVTSGLMPGEVVVMTGVDKLQEGSKVNVQGAGTNGANSQTGQKSSKADKTPKGK